MLLSHTNTITMGDIRAPSMDWSHPDRASTYKLFKQKACMYFECKDTHLNKQVAHILLMTGEEGVRMYNSWGLPAEESKIPAVIWETVPVHAVHLRGIPPHCRSYSCTSCASMPLVCHTATRDRAHRLGIKSDLNQAL